MESTFQIAGDSPLASLTVEQRRYYLLLRAALYEARAAFRLIDREGGCGKLSSETAGVVKRAAQKGEEVFRQTTATLYPVPTPSVPPRTAEAVRKVWRFDPAHPVYPVRVTTGTEANVPGPNRPRP